MSDIQIESLTLGMIDTNCYLLMNKDTKELIIIDPAAQSDKIENQIQRMGAQPAAILLTHGHFDHILAVEELKKTYHIPVYAYKTEQDVLENAEYNLSARWAKAYSIKADHLLADQEELLLAGICIHILHTPGHTAGGVCFYLPDEKVLFSGDTLFAQSYGRTDLPTGSLKQMKESVSYLLRTVPSETKVYPGHGVPTEISIEKRYNPLA